MRERKQACESHHQWKVYVSILRLTDASSDPLDSERNTGPAASGGTSAEWKTDN